MEKSLVLLLEHRGFEISLCGCKYVKLKEKKKHQNQNY